MHAKGITGLLERIIGRSQTGSYKDIRDGLKKLKPRIWERERACKRERAYKREQACKREPERACKQGRGGRRACTHRSGPLPRI